MEISILNLLAICREFKKDADWGLQMPVARCKWYETFLKERYKKTEEADIGVEDKDLRFGK